MKRLIGLILLVSFSGTFSSIAGALALPEEKILLVRADASGNVLIGRDTLTPEGLAKYVEERLFKSYLGTGKMHDKILIQWTEEGVTDQARLSVVNAIKDGQSRALTDICLQKHEKKYDALDAKKQEKLKKQFPVLFQESFEPETPPSR